VGAADRLGPGVAQAEVTHLARGDELGHRADRLLDRHASVDAAGVVEVDRVDAEAAQRVLDRLARVGAVNRVAMTTWSRRPLIALPTSRSFAPCPSSSAVSRNVMPSSSARWIVPTPSASSAWP
jgi:hypothetical protein